VGEVQKAPNTNTCQTLIDVNKPTISHGQVHPDSRLSSGPFKQTPNPHEASAFQKFHNEGIRTTWSAGDPTTMFE